MLVRGKPYQTIWVDENDQGKIKFINQHYLPFRLVIDELSNSEEAYVSIREMKVRGAPLIGAVAAFGIYLAAKEARNMTNPLEYIISRAEKIKTARPTAVNLNKAVEQQLRVIARQKNAEGLIRATLETSLHIMEQEKESCRQIGLHGLPLIEKISLLKQGDPVNILTHCNAGWLACIDYGTATAPIYYAHDLGINIHVWIDETRPRNQGSRLTAWELGQHGVPHTVIVDNAGGHLMQQGMIDMVIVGSDRTTLSGDVVNKTGTYLKALAAIDNNVPFYVALPSSSIDFSIRNSNREIPIEERHPDEIRYVEGLSEGEIKKVLITPGDSPVSNYGFDITPARLITGLITERGICEASEKGIRELYPDEI